MERPRRERALWSAAALVVFGVALAAHFAPLRQHDLRVFVLAGRTPSELEPEPGRRGYDFTPSDRRFAVSLVAQNARALVTRPLRLYDAEPCHPADDALALGHPGLPLGLLGAPAWLATGDPVATYNFAVAAQRLLAALAMFLLVASWTGIPAAGIVAGLLYAFHLPNASALTYPFVFDTAWAVLGLFFARRFFAAGRWRDALALAACCALQLTQSFYALLASALVAVPLGVWLALHHGARQLRAAPTLVALAIVAATAVAGLGPILRHAGSVEAAQRGFQAFASWWELRPGRGTSGLGFALAVAGLALPRRRALGGGEGDPRWALAAAALLVALVVTGGNETSRIVALARGEEPPPALPNLYAVLDALLPGLGTVRAPGYAASGVHLALCVLAGFGAAALLRLVPARWAAATALALILAAGADALRPQALSLTPNVPLEPVRMRPPEEDVAFFEALARRGNRGPLFEVPLVLRVGPGGRGSAISQVLLSTYHHRRTSGCYNSILPPETRALAPIAERLAAAAALAALRERGFTTIVVHHPRGEDRVDRFEAATRDGALRRVHAGRSMTAYALAAAADRPRPRRTPR